MNPEVTRLRLTTKKGFRILELRRHVTSADASREVAKKELRLYEQVVK